MERFWQKVEKPSTVGCWRWLGCKNTDGYGIFRIDGKNQGAHRQAWILVSGDPGKKFVLHRCDNRECVNPNHLYLGDHRQNMRDRGERGRQAKGDQITRNRDTARGERAGISKLTEWEVQQIRARYTVGVRRADLARTFKVSLSLIDKIIQRVAWAHLLSPEEIWG